MIKDLMQDIIAAPEFMLVSDGGNRKSNVEAMYEIYRAKTGVDHFSMDMPPYDAIDFMIFVWDLQKAYERAGQQVMESAGLTETVVGAARVKDIAKVPSNSALSVFNYTLAKMNFDIVAEHCERFVKWRCKQNG